MRIFVTLAAAFLFLLVATAAFAEDESELKIKGKGNQTTIIEELTININLNDVESVRGGDADINGIVQRLLDLVGMTREPGPGVPDGPGMMDMREGFSMRNFPRDTRGNWSDPTQSTLHYDSQYREQTRQNRNPDSPPEPGIRPTPNIQDMPEAKRIFMRMMQEVPDDIDPEFMKLMFRVGQLAWENPRLREHLMQMVERIESGETDIPVRGR